eukprot:superscaffoldBa00001654_g11478
MCYAVGGVPFQITSVAIGISLQIFLLDVVQMEAFYVSMILFVSRVWDAVTDPLVGYLVSRSNWTPIGKLTPWLVLSTPFGVLSYLLLWFVPRGSMSQAVSVLWFLTTSCLFETLMSCYNVPYLSLNMFLGGDQRDRDSATAYRMSVEMVAMLLASVIQGRVVAVYNTEKQEACLQQDEAHETPQSSSPPLTALLQETLFIPAVIIVACVPSNLPVFMTMCILMGFSVATIFLLPWSMLPDVVDDFAVRHPSCKDLEPLFFSCYAFCSKLAGGLSVGISTMTLQ